MKKILLLTGTIASAIAPISAVIACGTDDTTENNDDKNGTAGKWQFTLNGETWTIEGPADGSNPAGLEDGVKNLSGSLTYTPETTTSQKTNAAISSKAGTSTLTNYSSVIGSGTFEVTTTELDATYPLNESVKPSKVTQGVWTTTLGGVIYTITGPTDGTNPKTLADGSKDIKNAFAYVAGTPAQDATLAIKAVAPGQTFNNYQAQIKSGSFTSTTKTLNATYNLTQDTEPSQAKAAVPGVWVTTLGGVLYTITGPTDGTNPKTLATETKNIADAFVYVPSTPAQNAKLTIKTVAPGQTFSDYEVQITNGGALSTTNAQAFDLTSVNLTQNTAPDSNGPSPTRGEWTVDIDGVAVTITGPADGSNGANLNAGDHNISALLDFKPYVAAIPATLNEVGDLTGTALEGYQIATNGAVFNGQDVDLSAASLLEGTPPVEAKVEAQGVWTTNVNGAVVEIKGPADGSNGANLNAGDHDIRGLFTFTAYQQKVAATLNLESDLTGTALEGYNVTNTGIFNGDNVDLTAVNLSETTPPVDSSAVAKGKWTTVVNGATVTIEGPADGSNGANLNTGDHDIRDLFTFVKYVPVGTTPSTFTIKTGQNIKLNGYTITKTSGDFSASSSDLTQLNITEQVKPIANS